jgi:hypothetical protein
MARSASLRWEAFSLFSWRAVLPCGGKHSVCFHGAQCFLAVGSIQFVFMALSACLRWEAFSLFSWRSVLACGGQHSVCFHGAQCLLAVRSIQFPPRNIVHNRSHLLAASIIRAMNPDDGGSKHLWNVGKFLPDYTEQQPRRWSSSYWPPWEPEISQILFIYGLFNDVVNSSVQPVLCLIIGWSVNNESESKWKDGVVFHSRHYPGICLKETHENPQSG